MTTATYIITVMERVGCNKHNADVNEACWTFESAKGQERFAICNRRALRAGVNGKISPKALARK